MPSTFQIELTSVPDRDDLVAEIWLDQDLFVELRLEAGEIRTQLYSRQDGKPWDVSHRDLLAALSKAEERLLE